MFIFFITQRMGGFKQKVAYTSCLTHLDANILTCLYIMKYHEM